MGLTKSSSGFSVSFGDGFFPSERPPGAITVAFLGNPNVGKSSLFNALTGMNQHTGNWPGKTVTAAVGKLKRSDPSVFIADLPGTYSLIADSAEEEVARNCILFDKPDICVVVCDASSPARGLPLALQAMEISERVIVCFNLCDQAKKNGITIDTDLISERLGVPVICTSARDKKSIEHLSSMLKSNITSIQSASITYPTPLCDVIDKLSDHVNICGLPSRFIAHRLIEGDESLLSELKARGMYRPDSDDELTLLRSAALAGLEEKGYPSDPDSLKDATVNAIMATADSILENAVSCSGPQRSPISRRADRILTGRLLGYPIMLCLLLFSLWLTIVGANYPSALLARLFDALGNLLSELLTFISTPAWLHGILIDGVYRVLAFIVSVMLPPMAIFFPLFTLLEDVGYLPRIAYNLDRPFNSCGSCGKQALTMCMGLGCNAAGVVGCRIIDSPRERLLSVLTNSFVPCNGRFPTLIAIITVFFAVSGSSFIPAIILTGLILLGIIVTFGMTKLLSVTLFKGEHGVFALELPPFRAPRVGRVIVRSIFDRTLFVLGRAVVVAAPAGALIWLMANVTVGDVSILAHASSLLDPIGRIMGLDGVILLGFILGFPANEIVLPIIIMTYTASGVISDVGSHLQIGALLTANGWTTVTTVCFMIFSIFHWPCSTTVLTVKKETGSLKAALLSVLLPTLIGFLICVMINLIARI